MNIADRLQALADRAINRAMWSGDATELTADDVRLLHDAVRELRAALEGLVERGTDSPQHLAAEAALRKAAAP